MKTIIIFFLCLFFSVVVFGQIEQEKMKHVDVDEVKVVPPKFTGIVNSVQFLQHGQTESIKDYLAKRINSSTSIPKYYSQGTEVIQFVVSPKGEVSDFTIINGLSPQINEEVIRILETTDDMWIPGYNNGDAVAMEREISLVFQNQGSNYPEDFQTLAAKHFHKASIALFTKGSPRKAVKLYNKGIILLPNDKSLLYMRGLARFEVGDTEGAYKDWERINTLGGNFKFSEHQANTVELKGYAEASRIIGN